MSTGKSIRQKRSLSISMETATGIVFGFVCSWTTLTRASRMTALTSGGGTIEPFSVIGLLCIVWHVIVLYPSLGNGLATVRHILPFECRKDGPNVAG